MRSPHRLPLSCALCALWLAAACSSGHAERRDAGSTPRPAAGSTPSIGAKAPAPAAAEASAARDEPSTPAAPEAESAGSAEPRTEEAAPPVATPVPESDGTPRGDLARLRAIAPKGVPEGSLLSIEHALDVAERIERGFPQQSASWTARAKRWLKAAEQGRDPLLGERGAIAMRGYRSPISEHLQGYAVYVPKGYDPSRRYPLMVMLHGGSANGNLFLGVVLGNNMSWKAYSQHLWDDFTPRYEPDWIVVAPDGFGHVMWRWMGEQDVLDVIEDVQKHYAVDEDRIVLGGLSNGGVGAYNIGMRHASRFAAVTAIAGAPSWLQYAGGSIPQAQQRMMEALSGMQLAENALATDFRYYHGHTDGGPMKPRFVRELTEHISTLGVPFKEKWYDAGHDLLYLVHRHGKIYDDLSPLRRKQSPSEVRVQTGDYRASRQHWVNVTRIEGYPAISRVRAVAQGDRIELQTKAARAIELDWKQAPLAAGDTLRVVIDGAEVLVQSRATLPSPLPLTREAERWRSGPPSAPSGGLEKRLGVSGPITDSYYGAVAHVYGTGDAAARAALEAAARRGAKGQPLWLWRVQQKVLADTEVTDELMRSHHLVLYATPGSHALLERMQSKLPLRVDASSVTLGSKRFSAKGVGVKLVFPNPLAPERYVIVQAAPTTAAVDAGNRLPDFLPDYVVYDASITAKRPRLTFSTARAPLAMGYFDDFWRLPPELAGDAAKPEDAKGAALDVPAAPSESPDRPLAPASAAPVLTAVTAVASAPDASPASSAPPVPPRPTKFLARASTQAGQAARSIARRVAAFPPYRMQIPRATWAVDPLAVWSIRDNDACLRALRKSGVRATAFEAPLATPVPTPVEVTSPVAGLRLRMVHEDRTLLMSCEMAARLPELARVLKAQGVRGVDVISTYRDHPWASFHTLGLALDIARFHTQQGPLSVLTDFERSPDAETCASPEPASAAGKLLRDIACALAESRAFSSVLTPNYNAGHHDHFHLDVRPDDPRLFIR